MSYYPSYEHSSKNTKVELDLPNYATKSDIKKLRTLMLLVLRVRLI